MHADDVPKELYMIMTKSRLLPLSLTVDGVSYVHGRASVSSSTEVLQEDGIAPPTNIANLVFILVCSLTIHAYFLTTNPLY